MTEKVVFQKEVKGLHKKVADLERKLAKTEKVKETEEWIPHDPMLVQTATDRGLDGLDVHYAGVTREFVDAATAAGQKLYVWTVDDPDEANRLVGLGVSGITTNRPEWLRRNIKNQ